jgi:hypothetical protein
MRRDSRCYGMNSYLSFGRPVLTLPVIPAKAGIREKVCRTRWIIPEEHNMRGVVELFTIRWSFTAGSSWIPAFAGMTKQQRCRRNDEAKSCSEMTGQEQPSREQRGGEDNG